MQTSKSLWLGSLALLLAMITTPAWAQGKGRDGGNADVHANTFVAPHGDDQGADGAPAASSAADHARDHQRSLDEDTDRVHQRRQRHHADTDAHAPDRRQQRRDSETSASLVNAPGNHAAVAPNDSH